MDRDPRPRTRKLGSKRNERAVRRRRDGAGFSRSKDISEDRGTRQAKLGARRMS